MLDALLRKFKEMLLYPAARITGKFLHPNGVTVVAFLFGLVCFYLILQKQYIPALIFWLVNRIVDGLDGTIARIYNKQSDFGGYLDIMLDFVIYAMIPIGLVMAAPSHNAYLTLALLLALYYVNGASWMYLSSILEKRKQGAASNDEMTSVTMPSGLVGGTETIILYCLFILLHSKIVILFLIMSVLLIITIIQRMIWAWLKIK